MPYAVFIPIEGQDTAGEAYDHNALFQHMVENTCTTQWGIGQPQQTPSSRSTKLTMSWKDEANGSVTKTGIVLFERECDARTFERSFNVGATEDIYAQPPTEVENGFLQQVEFSV